LFFGTWVTLCQFLYKVLAPYFVVRFLLTPLPFFVANYLFNGGSSYAMNALWSFLLAEVATNVHSFVVIATNHAGDDLYRFNVHCKPHSGTFYLRQVLSSANFSCGDDLTDFMHGWLNYQVGLQRYPLGGDAPSEPRSPRRGRGRRLHKQTALRANRHSAGRLSWALFSFVGALEVSAHSIVARRALSPVQVEHHMWPQLSMLSYQRAQPLVQEICQKHGIPYVKHNVFWRLHKLAEIMVGSKAMRKFPVAFEHKPDISVESAEVN
jgi:hypothetical protein